MIKNMKRKFWALLPTILLFAMPWTHRLVYYNILAAWPDMDPGGAHFVSIFGTVIATVASFIIWDIVR